MDVPARLAVVVSLVLTALEGAPASVGADGLPAGQGLDAAPVSAPGGRVEFLTQRARAERGARSASVVIAREIGSERVLRRLRMPGRFSVPAVRL